MVYHLTKTDGAVHLLVCKVRRLVLRSDLRICPQRYSWETSVRGSSDGGVGISFRLVHITVTFETRHCQKQNYIINVCLNTIYGKPPAKQNSYMMVGRTDGLYLLIVVW